MNYYDFDETTSQKVINGSALLLFYVAAAAAVGAAVYTFVGYRLAELSREMTMLIFAGIGLVLFLVDMFSTKGIFVFDDHIEIVRSIWPSRFKKIPMERIGSAIICFDCRRDQDYKPGGKGLFNWSNFIAGSDYRNCAKIVIDGRVYFLSADDSHALVADISNRLSKYRQSQKED